MKRRCSRWGLGAVAAALIAVGIHLHSLPHLLTLEGLTHFFQRQPMGPGSIALFLGAHILTNAVGLPGTLLVVVGGAVYGLWWGTFWSVVGATLGAIAAFCLARYLCYDWFAKRFHHRPLLRQLNRALRHNSLSCVLALRISPISPFNLVNFAFGLTPVPLKFYALGTLVGIVPGTAAYTWLGAAGAKAIHTGHLRPLLLGLGLLALLGLLPLVLGRRQSPRKYR